MNEIALAIAVGTVIIISSLWLAFKLGKHFGKQEQLLLDLRRAQEERAQEIRDRQKEIEDDWQQHWEGVQAEKEQPKPDAPVPNEPAIYAIRRANNF